MAQLAVDRSLHRLVAGPGGFAGGSGGFAGGRPVATVEVAAVEVITVEVAAVEVITVEVAAVEVITVEVAAVEAAVADRDTAGERRYRSASRCR
jgi:hypothetical protein